MGLKQKVTLLEQIEKYSVVKPEITFIEIVHNGKPLRFNLNALPARYLRFPAKLVAIYELIDGKATPCELLKPSPKNPGELARQEEEVVVEDSEEAGGENVKEVEKEEVESKVSEGKPLVDVLGDLDDLDDLAEGELHLDPVTAGVDDEVATYTPKPKAKSKAKRKKKKKK